MYETYLNNRFTNALIMYILFFWILAISPFLFFFQFINTIAKLIYPSEKMAGKVVLVTGASSGIGEHLAYEYAKKGANLVIVARREERLKQVAKKAREFGSPDVLYVCADVSKYDDCKRYIDETINHFGRLDHLVCNAGTQCVYTTDMDVTKFLHLMEVNFWGYIYATSLALPHLKRSKGKILVNASACVYFNPPDFSFITASKAAGAAYFESLRVELGSNVKITIAYLGYIESEMGKGIIETQSNEDKAKAGYKKDYKDVFPEMGTQQCAKLVVEATCRGERIVTQPQFWKIYALVKFLFPEAMEWYLRNIYLPQLRQLD